ncbi:sugar phosphate isomerase [Anaerolinea thermolimosa]|uniref:sugar phosphate isomerase/epimerase family protein n=1 Tax=Anaerolinea thermolimosa TaxID=229919 RepID=UPI000785DEEF|nr:sugar phosphate isomerase/epimerase [Anaerolinea thermolimosa]GAP05982.1 sugar phosphate isomerase [Anaerolinea thermolimosa]
MRPKMALQLYTLRDLTSHDFEGVVRKVAAMGYEGVETAGFGNSTPNAARHLLDSLGLEVVGLHAPMPLGEHQHEVIDNALLFGCRYLVTPHIGREDVKDMDAIRKLCDRLNQSQEVARAHGMTLAIHNHWWEYARMDDRLIADIMIDLLDPAILFELDTYWIKVAGVDPAERVRQLGKRAPLLHIKDGPGVRDEPQTALGEGIMDFASIRDAGSSATEWWIMEADRVNGDPLEAVEKSIHFMKGLLQ